MHDSIFWVEWLDRLHRVLNSARADVKALSQDISPRTLAAIQSSKRQLSALTNDLRLLDRAVLAPSSDGMTSDLADKLQQALETTLYRFDTLADVQAGTVPAIRDRVLAAIDSALRDSRYEAAMLLEPARQRA
jgi:hypothetical protein